METFKAVVYLLLGFVLLIKGADCFVDGSSSVAKRLHVPSIVIGLTIVAMGTSLPECAVSVTASINNNNTLAISNAIGSNIFNLMVVCGACALFAPLAVNTKVFKKEFPFSIICAIFLLGLGYLEMELGYIDSIVLIIIFVVYLVWMIISAKKARTDISQEEAYKVIPVWKTILYIVGGAVAIKYGGDFVVNGASVVAGKLGLSQTLIGLTVVALGTSLPELVTSIVAAKKNEVDMALGNVIGSNIFNILFVLGISGVISPVAFMMDNIIDIVILIIMSIFVWVFGWTKKEISKAEGIIMLLMYLVYLVYICVR
ncbi:MAG: calcium/sodium antiporter [Lachnospira sp.]|jgi:cation:H+ antiporter|nr:calcium/sodium antiporter [Lachnospira sp.]